MATKFDKYAMARTLTEGIRYCEDTPNRTDAGEDVLNKTGNITPEVIDRKVKGAKQDAKLSPIPTKNNAEPGYITTGMMTAPKKVIETVLSDIDEASFNFGDKSKIPGSHAANSPKRGVEIDANPTIYNPKPTTVKDKIRHAGLHKSAAAPAKPEDAEDDDEKWINKNVSVDKTIVPDSEAAKRTYRVAQKIAGKK